MSSKSLRAAGTGEEFVRPFTDLCADLEAEYQVVVSTELLPTGRRGVLDVRLLATRTEDPVNARPMACVALDWPHSTIQSLPALLYSLAFKLGRLVEDSRRDQDMRLEKWRK